MTDRKGWLMILMMHLLMMIIIIIMMMWGNTVDCDENECDSFMNSISTHTHTRTHYVSTKSSIQQTARAKSVPHHMALSENSPLVNHNSSTLFLLKWPFQWCYDVLCPILKKRSHIITDSKIRQASIAQWSWNWQPHHHPFAIGWQQWQPSPQLEI